MNKPIRFIYLLIAIVTISCSSDGENERPDNIPISADFSFSTSEIFVNESVVFTDNSTGNPATWTWTFEGGNPSSSNERNPTVRYENQGTYNVGLVIANNSARDEITKEGIITVNNNLSIGLIGQILLNGNAEVSSGNIPNGQVFGNVNPTRNRKGEENMAMAFNENEGYINFGSISELEVDYQSSISISVWINPNGNQVGWDTILNQFYEGPPPSPSGRFYLGINPNNQKVRWTILGYNLESSNSIPINTWTHIAITYRERKASLYVNGLLDGEINFGTESLGFGMGAPFKIGKKSLSTSPNTGFSGKLDDINIFNRKLDLAEVNLLFEQ